MKHNIFKTDDYTELLCDMFSQSSYWRAVARLAVTEIHAELCMQDVVKVVPIWLANTAETRSPVEKLKLLNGISTKYICIIVNNISFI